jgi:hypothetical protein
MDDLYFWRARSLYEKMKNFGVRIFKVRINHSGGQDTHVFAHWNKTTDQWRDDVRDFLASERNDLCDPDGNACVGFHLYEHLLSLGYCDLDDVISDIYEGRIAILRSRIDDDPDHEDQETGFGHYGWDSKTPPSERERD